MNSHLNTKCFYFAEGECEEKLINALKVNPSLIIPGKVTKFNVIKEELKYSQVVKFPPNSIVVFVFDTDVPVTIHLQKNIKLVKKCCPTVSVMTVVQILNLEDEIVRSTDVKKAPDFTRSRSVDEFKSDFCRLKTIECRRALDRHNFNIDQLWIKSPTEQFSFISQDSKSIKI